MDRPILQIRKQTRARCDLDVDPGPPGSRAPNTLSSPVGESADKKMTFREEDGGPFGDGSHSDGKGTLMAPRKRFRSEGYPR